MQIVVFTLAKTDMAGYNNDILKYEGLTEDIYRPTWAAQQSALSETWLCDSCQDDLARWRAY